MNEQRFKLDSDDENEPSEFFTDYGDFWEDGTPKTYWFDDYEDFEDIVDLLNKQQDTIFKLQDLCGKSDYENTKLRIENKMLEKEVNLLKPTNIEQFEQIQKLQEENEKLRKELGDCEKFRYQVFKRMNDEYIKECSIR